MLESLPTLWQNSAFYQVITTALILLKSVTTMINAKTDLRQKMGFKTALLMLATGAVLIIPNHGLQSSPNKGAKSMDQYWSETGLGSTELEMILEKESCAASPASFLGCVNALDRMGERYDLTVSTGGQWRPLKRADGDTEKDQLAAWQLRPETNRFGHVLNSKVNFLKLWQELESKHVRPDEKSSVIGSGINGYLSVAHDPHTYILPVAEYQEIIASSETKQDKLGFVFRRTDNKLVVRKIFKGSPAATAGLKKYDEIVAINSKPTLDLSMNQLGELLRIPFGDSLTFSVIRGNERKDLELTKTFGVYTSVEAQLQQRSVPVGIITLHKFSKDVCLSFKKELISMIESGAKGMIVDLRDNPGGQLDEAACIANLFLKKGTALFETRFLDPLKPSEPYIAENEIVYSGPVAILINSGSASASEILAGTMKDHGRATLVGERTFGKGSFQDGRIWANNPKIALFQTEGLYYFPSGWTPQMVGLEPDVPVRSMDAHDRESDLFTNPIVPRDQWTGPQSLAWLNQLQCSPSEDSIFQQALAGTSAASNDDQVENAMNWIACKQKNLFGSQRSN